MFNTSKIELNNTVQFNTPASGIIQKSHAKSFMRRMHTSSKLAQTVFSNEPTIDFSTSNYTTQYVKVIVLQVLLMSEGELMVELIKASDYQQP